ncbi:MAG: hypothetical protein ACYC5Y_11555 [Symbiobacteriia bacterium]
MVTVLAGLLLAWYSLLFVGVPGLSGRRLRLSDEDAWQYVLLEGVFGAGFAGLLLRARWAPGLLLFVLIIWGALQVRAHWMPMIFGAPAEFVQGYNTHFGSYWRILPRSDRRVVPDAFHTIQSLLILATFVALVFGLAT